MSNPRGPQPGQTPSDQDELHGNPNQYAQGSPRVDDSGVSNYPALSGIAGSPSNPSVLGYYFNPPADPNNPYSDGLGIGHADSPADQSASRDALDGLTNAYIDVLSNRQPDFSEQPTMSDYRNDSGYGRDGEGHS